MDGAFFVFYLHGIADMETEGFYPVALYLDFGEQVVGVPRLAAAVNYFDSFCFHVLRPPFILMSCHLIA